MSRGTFNTTGTWNLTMDGTGNVSSGTGVSSLANTGVDAAELQSLRNTVTHQREVIDRLKIQVEDLVQTITEYDEKDEKNFTKEELAFILSRVHPDKNPNSNIATKLTSKLIMKRKGA